MTVADDPLARMLPGAVDASDALRRHPYDEMVVAFHAGFMAAMSAATGCDAADLEAWMDRHAVT